MLVNGGLDQEPDGSLTSCIATSCRRHAMKTMLTMTAAAALAVQVLTHHLPLGFFVVVDLLTLLRGCG